MSLNKVIFTFAIAMALAIVALTFTTKSREATVTIKNESTTWERGISLAKKEQQMASSSVKRVSRFLVQDTNPREKFHCNKDGSVCLAEGSPGATCCNNKCINLDTDNQNCGSCKNKCNFRETCCGGKCVDLSYDKRHCGSCNNKCKSGSFCLYGMCDYA
ncbi:hypothetical protein Sjap_025204 [Stephania japonica]|uniref:Stigma-specific STIG1-like protein 1 n=1 Tax=Stephania japonica TaxID=461633 RepID=A0AAP0HE08_9MAGN